MPYNYIANTGAIQPDTGDILEEVQQEFTSVFGDDLDLSPETPQGLLIAAEVAARESVVRNNATLANQINPNLAGGTFLDAIAGLTGIQREGAKNTIINATLYGVANTVVPAGARTKTINGDIFELTANAIIDGTGTVAAVFVAEEEGAIAANVSSLTEIIDGVLGWERVDNLAAGVVGQSVQADYPFRVSRNNALAAQGVALNEAIMSGLSQVDGLKSNSYYENFTKNLVNIDGVDIEETSIYVCADGGEDDDIAAVLLAKKSLGCGWVGSVTVDIREQFSNQLYTVRFDRPTDVRVLIEVSVRTENEVIDAQQSVIDALLSFANSEQEGEKGFEVGRNVSSWELGGAINRAYPTIFVQSLETSVDDGATYTPDEKPININQVARLAENDITVTVL